MNIYEQFACGQIFSTYPSDKSFSELCDLCENDANREAFNYSLEDTDNENQQLTLCERYEFDHWENIPSLLEELMDGAKHYFPNQEVIK